MTAAGGTVNGRLEATLRLRVRGPSGAEAELSAVVDTGFNGWLAVPPATAAALGLAKRTTGSAQLGDGSSRGFDVFAAEVWSPAGWRTVSAAGIGRDPLVGTRFLAGHRLTVDVVPGGAVDVAPLPP